MYVIESHKDKDQNTVFYRALHEVTQRMLDNWVYLYRDDPCRSFKIVSGQIAHKWVRDGGLHTTSLYVDGNFIRKAKSLD